MEKLVYIILINYNSKIHTVECVKSLNNIFYKNYKILIIDNNSEDNDFSEIEDLNNKVLVIKNKSNFGFAAANNIGIEIALKNNAEYILLLNNDTVVTPNFLNILIDEYENDNNIGICTSKILYYDFRDTIWYGGGSINKIKGNICIDDLNKKDFENKKSKECEFASGCCMLLSSEVINKVGLMSEKYFLYYEDVDYSSKFLKASYKIKYCPKSVIYHKESVSTKKFSYLYQYYFVRNRLIFIKENLDFIYKLTAYPITILWVIKKIICKNFNIRPCALGIKDFLINRYGKK